MAGLYGGCLSRARTAASGIGSTAAIIHKTPKCFWAGVRCRAGRWSVFLTRRFEK